MTLVRIIKDWDWLDIRRLSPGGRGIWDGIEFTTEPVETADYVVVLNRVPEDTAICCRSDRIWAVIQEPPVPEYRWLRAGFDQFSRVYSQDTSLRGAKHILSQPALPWHVNRDYDTLQACSPPDKLRPLSWITSSTTGRSGHRRRLKFLESLRASKIEFDLWGRGFNPIDDKWDGLAPYRYAIAVENHSAPFYWTEKLADCFLSWTMPIYYGCTNINTFFPPEAMICIDIGSPDALVMLEEAVRSNLWMRNRDAIAYARDLVLNHYQFYPWVSRLVQEEETDASADDTVEWQVIHLHHLPYLYPQPLHFRVNKLLRRLLKLPIRIANKCRRLLNRGNSF